MKSHSPACDESLLESLLKGELHDEQCMRVESHLEGCPACRHALDSLAAEPDAWSEVKEQLSDFPSIDATPRSGSPDGHLTLATSVANLLAPTDDPQMLGRLGAYEIAGIIGSGGMGVVLKGWDRSLSRFVAIKVLAPQLAANVIARKRFAREAQAAAAVVHDNVVAIHGVSEANGLPYLVMPYIRGQSLQKRLTLGGPLRPVEVLRVGHQIAAGLAAAHAQGLVHRDIKPANILLEDGIERLRITDFGLARAVDDSSFTQEGTLAGTPEYMSPEQARGESVGPLSDLFSLGSLLYATCTGRSPFRSESSHSSLRKITDESPRLIRELNPDVPQWLEAIVLKLLGKSSATRFQSAKEVADLMLECLAHVQHPTLASLPARAAALISSETVRTSEYVRWRNRIVTVSGFLVVAIGLFLAFGGQDAESPKSSTNGTPNTRSDQPATSSATSSVAATLVLDVEPYIYPAAKGFVRSMTYSADGTRLAVGMNDGTQASKSARGTVQIWSVADRRLQATLPIRGGVFSVDFSKNGEKVAVGNGQGAVEVLSVESGRSLWREQIGTGDTVARFSLSERWLVGGCQSGQIVLWDAETFARKDIEFEGNAEPVLSLAISEQDDMLAVGGGQFPPEKSVGNVRVWDLTSGNRLASMRHADPVMDVLLHRHVDRAVVTSACLDGSIRRADIATGEMLRQVRDKDSGLVAVRHMPDGERIATLGPQSGVKVWSLDATAPTSAIATLRGGDANMTSMAVSPDGKQIASGGHDRVITLWDVAEQKSIATLSADNDGWLPLVPIRSLAASRDGSRVVVGRADGGIVVRDVGTGRVVMAIPGAKDDGDHAKFNRGHLGAATVVTFLSNGKQVLSGGTDGNCYLWDVATGRWVQLQLAHQEAISDLAITPDDRTYFSASSDQHIAEWDIEKGVERGRWEAHDAPVTCVRVIDDSRLLTTSANGTAKIWKLSNHDLLLTCDLHNSAITATAVSSDGSTIATGTEDGHLMLWSTRTGWDRRALKKQTSAIRQLAFSYDGKSLISGGSDSVLRVWDVKTLEEQQAITAHRNGVTGASFLGREPIGVLSAGGDGYLKHWPVATPSARTDR